MNWTSLFRTKAIHQISQELSAHGPLHKALGVWDLTAFGVAAILGAGIFSTIGNAAADGGPAVVFLFIFTAIACAFSAFCYAEFASSIPISGSAYTYAYASFGEIFAWIVGWDLLMEYSISNVAVAISWSQYFTGLLAGYGVIIPPYFTMDFLSASRGYDQIIDLLQKGQELAQVSTNSSLTAAIRGYHSWLEAPRFLGIPLICDLPALLITVIITGIALIGIEESKRTSNILVFLKVLVVLLVIGVGATYVQPALWAPFAPHGPSGVLKGVSAVFFAYIGFDAISTTAEECKNPQRDLPRGMIYSLIICTVLYSLVALVLTGMVDSSKLGVGDPLAFVFGPAGVNIPWLAGAINISAVIALSTVLLVYQVGQPRIWMAMSRDGLLPPLFSKIHPKFKTPWVSTILTGVLVAVPSLFMNLTEVTDLTSIGTLSAFTIVCAGVLKLNPRGTDTRSKFRTPYINSKYIFPVLALCGVVGAFYFNGEGIQQFWNLSDLTTWQGLKLRIPFCVFSASMVILSGLCYSKELSLIPVLGLSTCGYLMTELGITNWIRFGVWLIVGFLVYFLYGVKHSRLRQASSA